MDIASDIHLPAVGQFHTDVNYLQYLVYRVWGEFDPIFTQKLNIHDPEQRTTFQYWWLAQGRHHNGITAPHISQTNLAFFSSVFGYSADGLPKIELFRAGIRYETFGGPRIPMPEPDHPNSDANLKWFYVHVVPYRRLVEFLPKILTDHLLGIDERFKGQANPLSRLECYSWELDSGGSVSESLDTPIERKHYSEKFRLMMIEYGGNGYEELIPPGKVMIKPPVISGVNLIGHVSSTSGVGEDLRMAQAAFSFAGIRSASIPFSGRDLKIESGFKVNLFCTTGYQAVIANAAYGPGLFEGHYNIGYFPWELEDWPRELVPALGLFDEFWTSTEFIADALRKVTDKPVLLMPMGVEVPEGIWPLVKQQQYKEKKEKVSFLFMFDFLSGIERKNAWACLEAFQRAFSNEMDVELVVKTINFNVELEFCRRLESLVSADRRIRMVNKMMERMELMELISHSDAFLSLHRAEGFGRGIAESMLLGKHVIVTDYSGNRDFNKPENSFLVEYDLIPVNAREYVFSQSQQWANVRIESAVKQLRNCRETVRSGKVFNEAGQRFIRARYSVSSVGERYASRLRELDLIGGESSRS